MTNEYKIYGIKNGKISEISPEVYRNQIVAEFKEEFSVKMNQLQDAMYNLQSCGMGYRYIRKKISLRSVAEELILKQTEFERPQMINQIRIADGSIRTMECDK